jgi:hypothetical protein
VGYKTKHMPAVIYVWTEFATEYGLIESILHSEIVGGVHDAVRHDKNWVDSKFWMELNRNEYPFITDEQWKSAMENLLSRRVIVERKEGAVTYYGIE